MPDFGFERALVGMHGGPIPVVGIDEVGLGSIAGPLCVAGVVLGDYPWEGFDKEIKESKKLSPKRREALTDKILRSCFHANIKFASPREIDEMGVQKALNMLMLSVYQEATLSLGQPVAAIVDGRSHEHLRPLLGRYSVFADKADDLSFSVAAASIIAKHTRDTLMTALTRDYPGYGWERNKGYPTKEHLDALETLGITPEHRRSYAPVKLASILKRLNDGD